MQAQDTLDALDDGVVRFDRDLRLLAWNRRLVELLEYPAAMMRAGVPFLDFVHFNIERGEHGSGERRIIVGQRLRRLHDTYERRRPNGVLIRVRGKALADGGFLKVFSELEPGGGPAPAPQVLSAREREVLLWAVRGKTAWESAAILGLSARTVEFHLANCRRKLGVVTKAQMVARAVAGGLVPL